MTMAPPARGADAVWLRALSWLLLGGWIGAWVLFAFVVAPTAFRVLPSTQIAGQLIGPVLTTLHLYGAAAGVTLSCLAWGLSRTGVRVWLPLAMSALCLVSQFGVTSRIEAIRPLVFGPQGGPEFAARFQLLHQLSMGIYTAVGLAAFVLVALQARADSAR
jgi:hypothetical protein